MVRTQIQLTELQARHVRALARELGISMAEVIRRCIDETLQGGDTDRLELYDRASALIGRFEDPDQCTDLSERHDDYLAASSE